ncbi:hypothetical protein C0995_014799, partial [Termitomyces sp. Mi166
MFTNHIYRELCRWLWAKLIRKVLKQFIKERNTFKSRKNSNKPGPSGMSRTTALKFPEQWGGKNCLLPIDVDVICKMKKEMGGDQLLAFSTSEFAERVEAAYATLEVQDLTFENVWPIFKDLYSLDKPQCAGCGLLYSGLSAGICNGCVNFYKKQPHVPREIFLLPGVARLLAHDATLPLESEAHHETPALNLVSALMSHAGTHRAQASDTQLHLGPPRTVQTTSSSNKFNNISRAHQINLERQQKKAEAKLREEEKGVTIIAALWKYDEKAKLVE